MGTKGTQQRGQCGLERGRRVDWNRKRAQIGLERGRRVKQKEGRGAGGLGTGFHERIRKRAVGQI